MTCFGDQLSCGHTQGIRGITPCPSSSGAGAYSDVSSEAEKAGCLKLPIAIRMVTAVVREAEADALAGGVIKTFAGREVGVALQSAEAEGMVDEDDLAFIGPARCANQGMESQSDALTHDQGVVLGFGDQPSGFAAGKDGTHGLVSGANHDDSRQARRRSRAR